MGLYVDVLLSCEVHDIPIPCSASPSAFVVIRGPSKVNSVTCEQYCHGNSTTAVLVVSSLTHEAPKSSLRI